MAIDLERLRRRVEQERHGGGAPAPPPEPVRVAAPVPPPRSKKSAWPVVLVVAALAGIGWFATRDSGSGPGAAPPPVAPVPPTNRPVPPKPAAPLDPRMVAPAVRGFIEPVVAANAPGIDGVLALAGGTTDKARIASAAVASGRGFAFNLPQIRRNRTAARALHDPVKQRLNEPNHDDAVCITLGRAFLADPLDAEIAGNLAICHARSKAWADARRLAVYALSLPKGVDSAGRTSDWVTLGAASAGLGDEARASAALFVALANVDDPVKRCISAVYTARHTLGPVLRPATEAMFGRIQALGLTGAAECSLPVAW